MFNYERGHCLIIGQFRHVVLDDKDDKVLLTHISDPYGRNSQWVLKDKLPYPVPIAKVDIDKYLK